ncbi:hypothetical protein ACFVQ9_25380 [Streptomyces goshikiensis]|uniref:hypothetical protein n=1 Tax=Streptomyces goshikiensis TaxID=1942 RepID=UPI00369A3A3C
MAQADTVQTPAPPEGIPISGGDEPPARRGPLDRIRARRRRQGDKAVTELRGALDSLGIERPIPEAMEKALRAHAAESDSYVPRYMLAAICLVLGLGTVAVAAKGAPRFLADSWDGLSALLVQLDNESSPLRLGIALVSLPLFGVMALIVGSVSVGSFLFIAAALRGDVAWRIIATPIGMLEPIRGRAHFGTHRLVNLAAVAVTACAKVVEADGEKKVYALSTVSSQVKSFAGELSRADRMRGSMNWRSPRGKAVRIHLGLVLGRLRDVELELDRAPGPALRKLANMMVTIADRYAEGRLGALLDDDLSAVDPYRKWLSDGKRHALAMVLTVGSVFMVAVFDMPQALEPYVVAGSAAAALALLKGPQVIADFRRRG